MRHYNPNVIDIDPSREAYALAQQQGVDVDHDASVLLEQLARDSDELSLGLAKSETRYIDHDGACYAFTQYDYTLPGKQIAASRMLAAIRPGDRTELAYWRAVITPKTLTIHRGMGTLALSGRSGSGVELIPLDASLEPEVILPPRSFYCLEADENSSGLLIISGLYSPPVKDWKTLEIEISPGQEYLTSQKEGMVRVPDQFRERYEA